MEALSGCCVWPVQPADLDVVGSNRVDGNEVAMDPAMYGSRTGIPSLLGSAQRSSCQMAGRQFWSRLRHQGSQPAEATMTVY